jgi:hypothetical protein
MKAVKKKTDATINPFLYMAIKINVNPIIIVLSLSEIHTNIRPKQITSTFPAKLNLKVLIIRILTKLNPKCYMEGAKNQCLELNSKIF